jgi:hypothetical protein
VFGRGTSSELADCTDFTGDNGADGTRLRIFLFSLKLQELSFATANEVTGGTA